MDDLCARELLDRLARTEPPPSHVDVGLARRRGRRILFWRRASAPGASALAVVAVALIVSNAIQLGPRTHGSASGLVRPRAVFSPLVPYASFGWLPAGFTLSAGSRLRWWGKASGFSLSAGSGVGFTDTATTQSVEVNADSPATGRSITLTVNTANSCTFGRSQPLTGKMLQNLRKRSPHWHQPPYQLTCGYAGGSGGETVGPVSAEVNGIPAYGGEGSLTWQYAEGSWAQVALGESNGWDRSAAAHAMLVRTADHIRFGEGTSEAFAFRLSGVPRSWRQYTTSYTEYGGRLANTTLWLGTGWATNGNAVQIAVTPAGKPISCGFVHGHSRYTTLDGTRFTLTTMPVPMEGDLEGNTQQELCGYVNGLQVNVGVATQQLDHDLSSLAGTDAQNVAVTVFEHMTLLGPNPVAWTTHPLG